MTGTIQGVEFTVIGLLGYELIEEGEIYDWVSSQLFSPTHGYAWITYNNGHVVFSRRVRELPDPPTNLFFRRKRKIRYQGEAYRLFEQFRATIVYAEGELTWIARQGDRVGVTEAVNPPKLFEYEQTGSELEYGIGHYLTPEEAEAAFQLHEPLPRADGIHPAQPFITNRFITALSSVGQIFCIVSAFAFVAWVLIGTGQTVATERISRPTQGMAQIPFSVSDPEQLIEVSFNAPVNNSWIFIEGMVASADETILALGREIGYYYGREGGESWTEGSRSGTVSFKVPAAGQYQLELETEAQDPAIDYLEVEIKQGVMPIRYLIALLIISVVSALSLTITKFGFESRRWGSEDDDDD